MKNSIGSSVILTVWGESHGSAVGVVLDGLCPGLPVDEAYIAEQLARRRPAGPADTARVEPDRFQLLSGVYRGRTTGAPLTILIPNEATSCSTMYPVTVTVSDENGCKATASTTVHVESQVPEIETLLPRDSVIVDCDPTEISRPTQADFIVHDSSRETGQRHQGSARFKTRI